MARLLEFSSIQFFGIDRLEPKFNPSIKKYTIYRKAGTEFSFQATLNRPPAKQVEYYDPAYPGYDLEYYVYGSDTRSFWSVDNVTAINCPVGNISLTIGAYKTKRNKDDNAVSANLSFDVVTESMTDEVRAACVHSRTITSEGEFWGGGSGSCQVEMISSCVDCGATVSTWYDHRN